MLVAFGMEADSINLAAMEREKRFVIGESSQDI